MTLVFFYNLRLKRGCLFKIENNQFELVAIRPLILIEKHKKFWQLSFIYTLSCSVSLLTEALKFQAID